MTFLGFEFNSLANVIREVNHSPPSELYLLGRLRNSVYCFTAVVK